MNDHEIEDLTRRARLYGNVDGSGEIELGLMLLGFALLGWVQRQAPDGSMWQRSDAGMAVMFAGVGLLHFCTQAFRRRVTYRRTGYAAPRRREQVRAAFIAMPAALLLALAVARHDQLPATLPVALVGLVLAALFGYKLAPGAAWKWGVAAVQGLGAIAIALWVTRFSVALQLLFVLFGLIWVVSGAASLVLYLRHTKAAPLEAE